MYLQYPRQEEPYAAHQMDTRQEVFYDGSQWEENTTDGKYSTMSKEENSQQVEEMERLNNRCPMQGFQTVANNKEKEVFNTMYIRQGTKKFL